PRPIVLIALVEVDELLHAARVNSGEPPDSQGKVPVRGRKVLRPQRNARVPVEVAVLIPVERTGRKHQARERPLGFFLIIGRKRDFAEAVLDAGKFTERPLKGEKRGQAGEGARGGNAESTQPHPSPPCHENTTRTELAGPSRHAAARL